MAVDVTFVNATRPLRTDPRTQVFGSLCVLVFLVNLGRVVYAPLLEPFRETFAASAGEVGLLATLVWVGSAAPRFPTGYLLTKVPRHRVVLASGLVLAGSATFAATANSLRMLYAGSVFVGLASGIYYVSASPLISQLFPGRVGRAIGINGTASQLAAVLAPTLVGVVLAVTIWPIAAWRVIFLLLAVAALGSSVLFAVTAKRAPISSSEAQDLDLRSALASQWRLICTGIAVVGLAGMVWIGVFNLYVTYLVEVKGFSAGRSRTLLTIVFATGVPAFWLSGRLADRTSFLPLLLAILAGYVACILALVAADGLLAVVAVSAVLGFVVHSLFPATDTYLLSSLPDEYRGSGYAVFSGTMMPIQAVGSALVGGLVDLGFSFDGVFLALAGAITILTGALGALAFLGRLPTGANG